jgi:sugar phosphate isomerase/epimerase
MKLGLSQACYRWIFYPHLRRDTPAYALSAERLPYYSTIPLSLDEADAAAWLVERCADLGLELLHVTTGLLGDERRAAELRRLAADRGVALIAAASANWVARGDEWRRDRDAYLAAMPIAVAAGASILCTTHAAPTVHNHFTKCPPIARQIEIMVENFGEVAPAAAEHRLTIAFENHQDYRASEIAAVIEGVGSPALRANLDTANPVAVIEDPLAAARSVGRYAVMVHLKDFRVQPSTVVGEPRILWAPIGRGDLDLEAVLEVLQAEAPDPRSLPVCLEVAPPHDHDPDQWVRGSLDHVRAHLGRFFA